MNPDLKHIYDELVEYTATETLMGQKVDIRVEENVFINVFINDEGGRNGRFKKPLMNVYFSSPGVLTVKFVLLERDRFGYLSEHFPLLPLEGNSFRVNFEKVEDFEHFIGSL